jgi:uncharacterized protein (TIGR00299 family) protein
MRILIIDPIGGISGDMLLGSLIDLGCPTEYLEEIYQHIPLGPFTILTAKKSVGGIVALDLTFETEHVHEDTTFTRIRNDIIEKLPDGVRETALKIFTALARAEAAVHGVSMDEVHFHEVGALDSILDIVGIAAALTWLKVDTVYTQVVPFGTGTTKSRHGIIPVPVPATVKLLEGFKVRFTGIEAELTTPTGAAVIRALAEKTGSPSDAVIKGVGYGCGDRTIPGWPNMCRVVLCDASSVSRDNLCYMVEADVDDMSPEEWEAATERIFAAGALDVNLTPRIMKKGRPGVGVKAICNSAELQEVLSAILEHTTTIGARYHALSRMVLQRREYTIKTSCGDVRIKEVVTPSGRKRSKPEYRDMHDISVTHNIPLARIRDEVEGIIRDAVKD